MIEQPIRYVTYLENLTLDGCYFQIPLNEHLNRMIEVSPDVAEGWVNYKADSDGSGVEIVAQTPSNVVVPTQVTMRQARLALLQIGKLSSVDIAINSLPSPQKEIAQIEWEFSSTVERHREITNEIATALGMTEQDLDSLFITASTL